MKLYSTLLTLVFAGKAMVAVVACGEDVDFNRDIRPILADKCYVCHGPDESSRKAGLRLDSFESATEYAIEPGDLENSEVFHRVTETDEDRRMPPADHGPRLTDTEQFHLREWIQSGAKYDKHWAYKKPMRPEFEGEGHEWSENEIDRLTYAVMKNNGLSPSEAAEPHALIRRVALDLTGLPPTLDELEQFLHDRSCDAYEVMVDRFLAKPAFGERWATVWLDQARYADSMGYAEDRSRTIWAYRDYVIRSFNENKPFDKFTIEQIAGDLLDKPTSDQIIATAFHRNTLTNTEGGTIDEEFRSSAVVDRTNTTMAVWMGTTMACAQCHTHKYDPITQEEYFQFYAFFNNTADNDQPDERPVFSIYSAEQAVKRQRHSDKIADLKSELASWRRLPASEKRTVLQPMQTNWENQFRDLEDATISGRYIKCQLPGERSILSLAEVQIFSNGENVALNGKAQQSSTAYDGPAKLAIDGITDGKFEESKSVTHTATESMPWWEIELDQDYRIDQVVVWNRTDGSQHTRLNGLEVSILNADRETIWSKKFENATREERKIVPELISLDILELIRKENRTESEQTQLQDYFASQLGPEPRLLAELESEQASYDSINPTTTVPVMQELPIDSRRETRIHHRGSYLDPGKLVTPNTPAALHPMKSEQRDRLALANWLIDEENPMSARVTVNRLWQQLFGKGIVTTSEDFGVQGELPTHPELLDYLACELMDGNWDLKKILKQILMSATYRQSSKATKESLAKDPLNRWLSRGPRFRLPAETIRDQALFVSGLLSEKMYGPPAQPPQPKLGLKFAFRGETADWTTSKGEDRYRRAVYTRWRRSSPYPSLSTFDVSNREVCELGRIRTNTPLQALVTLNDPVYIEAAQALARKAMTIEGTLRSRLAQIFQLVLIRPPASSEIDALESHYSETLDHFEGEPNEARQLAVDPLKPIDKDTNHIELAVWTTIGNVLLNLDETLMKP